MMLICLQRKSSGSNLSFNIIVKFKHTTPNSGKFLEKIGFYKPTLDKWSNKYIFINFDRLKFWLERGAKLQPGVFILLQPAFVYYLAQIKKLKK